VGTVQHRRAPRFTAASTVGEVIRDPAFAGFGRLLFPVDRPVDGSMTLRELSSSRIYLWYSDIQPEKTVEIVNDLYERAGRGERIFYPIYSQEERQTAPDKENTGLFFLRGRTGARFAILNAGGGFCYVAALQDSFPQALELSRRGINAFVLIYRPHAPWQDLARAICFVEDHAQELGVHPLGYSLWGGSAGARMAAALGNAGNLRQLTGRRCIGWRKARGKGPAGRRLPQTGGPSPAGALPQTGALPQAGTVITQYTGYDAVSAEDAPTYACVGTDDGIARWHVMKRRLQQLQRLRIPTEFHVYRGLHHGFGLGTETAAEGWIDDAVAFWKAQC
jgi:hypothetical protein